MNEQEQEKKVAAAFNAGYLMEQYEPALFQKIRTDANKQSEFVMHMNEGSRKYQKEQMLKQQKATKRQVNTNKPKH